MYLKGGYMKLLLFVIIVILLSAIVFSIIGFWFPRKTTPDDVFIDVFNTPIHKQVAIIYENVYERHKEKCLRCKDQTQSLCYEGFALFQCTLLADIVCEHCAECKVCDKAINEKGMCPEGVKLMDRMRNKLMQVEEAKIEDAKEEAKNETQNQ